MALIRAVPALLSVLAASLVLTGCGYQSDVTRLQPPDPALTKAQQKARRDVERQEVRRGLTVAADARPQRVDDLTVKLDMRTDDPFALPPAGSSDGADTPFPDVPPALPAADKAQTGGDRNGVGD